MEWPDDTPEAVRTHRARRNAVKQDEERFAAAARLCVFIRLCKPGTRLPREWSPQVFTEYCSIDGKVWTPLAYAIECMVPRLAMEMLKYADRSFVAKNGGPLLGLLARHTVACDADDVRLLGALLRAGADPNEILIPFGKTKPEYGSSLVAQVLAKGPDASSLLRELFDDPRLSDKVWSAIPGVPPVGLEAYAAEMGAFWAKGALAGWRRWGARRAWIGAVLRATLAK